MSKSIYIQAKSANRFDVYDNRSGTILGEITRDQHGHHSFYPESTQLIGEIVEINDDILTEVNRLNETELFI